MKAAILYGAKDIRIGEAPMPEIRPDEVLVESKAAGICGTDLHIYLGEENQERSRALRSSPAADPIGCTAHGIFSSERTALGSGL